MSHAWVIFGCNLFFVGVIAMPDENEVKQVQEPAEEQQQQQSTEQKPPPEQQVAETQAPEAAETPSENPNP
jgi:hypothetical protein